MLRHIYIIVLTVLFNGLLWGQAWMDDGSSTYADTWGSDAGLYGYGSTTGAMWVHDYAVDVVIYSPNRQASVTGGFVPYGSTVSNETMLGWDESDLGTYYITTTHRLYCQIALSSFTLASNYLAPSVSFARTWYSNPEYIGFPSFQCNYRNIVCTGSCGSAVPRSDWTPIGSCSPYLLEQAYLVTIFSNQYCVNPIKVQHSDYGPCY